jgi:hypothetical protein
LSEHLEDEFSRFTWFSILMYRLTLNPFFLESCAVGANATYCNYSPMCGGLTRV